MIYFLHHTGWGLISHIIPAIGKIKDPNAFDSLRGLWEANPHHKKLREAIIQALFRMDRMDALLSDEELREIMNRMGKENHKIRQAAIRILISRKRHNPDELVSILEPSSYRETIMEEIVLLEEKEARDLLARLKESKESSFWYNYAIYHLRKLDQKEAIREIPRKKFRSDWKKILNLPSFKKENYDVNLILEKII